MLFSFSRFFTLMECQFGLANHAISREVVLDDPRFKDFKVTISDEGY
jgi:hypothetical protein